MTDTIESSDGRHRRTERSRSRLLAHCRAIMQEGDFRPPMRHICARAGVCVRTGFQHFDTIESLHLAAINDGATLQSIADQVGAEGGVPTPIEGQYRYVRAIIAGRP